MMRRSKQLSHNFYGGVLARVVLASEGALFLFPFFLFSLFSSFLVERVAGMGTGHARPFSSGARLAQRDL